MEKRFRWIYSLAMLLILMELVQNYSKLMIAYYFNLYALMGWILLAFAMGWQAKVNKVILIIGLLLTLSATILLRFVIWN